MNALFASRTLRIPSEELGNIIRNKMHEAKEKIDASAFNGRVNIDYVFSAMNDAFYGAVADYTDEKYHDVSTAALKKANDGLQIRVQKAEDEVRELRLRVQSMADNYNLLAKEAVEIVEDSALSHAEKRGAMKWWRTRVWAFAQKCRYSPAEKSVMSDSEIPF